MTEIEKLKSQLNFTPKQDNELDMVLDGSIDLINTEIYNILYEHYVSNGEMPYGTAKARTGDPDFWITDQLK